MTLLVGRVVWFGIEICRSAVQRQFGSGDLTVLGKTLGKKAKRPVGTDLSGFSGWEEEPSLGVGC